MQMPSTLLTRVSGKPVSNPAQRHFCRRSSQLGEPTGPGERIRRAAASFRREETALSDFTIYASGDVYASVCTSLLINEATRCLNASTGSQWQKSSSNFRTGELNPHVCDESAEHQHYLFRRKDVKTIFDVSYEPVS